MSTKTRTLSNIDGANVGNPDMNQFAATSLESYANDAAFEADHGAGQAGDIYWNTTELCLREYNGTAWQYDKTIYGTQNDSTTTGSNQDITPGVNQIIRFTHGSLASIRSIVPTLQKQVDLINGQVSQNITIKNEDLTATAANRIVTGIDADVTLVPGQACRLVYDSVGLRWRLSGALQGAGSGLTDWASLTNNLAISASVAANALTVALKTKGGSDPSVGSPVLIGFRDSTLTSGLYNVRTVNSALSMVVSNGSTLGTTNGLQANLWIYALDNAGTVELAISQTLYDTSTVLSTTAEGGAGAADSAYVIYSTTARSNVPMRVIGKIVITEATAGVWATSPTTIAITSIPVGIPMEEGTFTATFTAVFATATTVKYSRLNNQVTLYFPQFRVTASGSGNSTTATAAIPSSIRPFVSDQYEAPLIVDNGAALALGVARVSSTGNIVMYRNQNLSGANWTTAAAGGWEAFSVTYSLV